MKTKEELQEESMYDEPVSKNWLPEYSWVLIVNLAYIIIFFLIMLIYS